MCSLVQNDTMQAGRYGRKGAPWEFNLRDVFRWCELMLREQQRPCSGNSTSGTTHSDSWEPWLMVDTLYFQRMRTRSDRDAVLERFQVAFPEAFQKSSCDGSSFGAGGIGTHPMLRFTPEWMQVGRSVLPRGCWSETPSRVGDGDGVSMPLAFRRPLQALARWERTLDGL